MRQYLQKLLSWVSCDAHSPKQTADYEVTPLHIAEPQIFSPINADIENRPIHLAFFDGLCSEIGNYFSVVDHVVEDIKAASKKVN